MNFSLHLPPASRGSTKRKMRVLQVIDLLGRGGAEMLQVVLAESIDRSRFDLHVIALRPFPGPSLRPQLEALGVPVTELNQKKAYDLHVLLELARYIRRHRIDIVHTHLIAADIMGRLAGFLTGTPVISSIHNSREDLEEEPKRRQWMERWTARLASRLVVVTDLLRQESIDWFGLPAERVVSIPNGIDTERFGNREGENIQAMKQELVGGQHPIVVNVARWTPQKAQKQLVDAAAIVRDARPDARFLLVGHGPMGEELREHVRANGLDGVVHFAGFREDVAQVLHACEIFALSSLWEGLPLALLEAMAAGCAAVSTKVGGVAEVILDGETGLLVPPGDVSALARAILRLLDDPEEARHLAHQGQRRTRERYGMRAWASQLERLYLQVARERRIKKAATKRNPRS